MKHKLSITLALVFLMMAFAAATARAQTVANGPYYANPSWDQTLPSSTRFIVLSNFANAAVLDRETGLVWERSPASTGIDWFRANNICIARTTGNRMGWRLPTINELSSLFDPSATTAPFLPSGHPFTGLPAQTGRFWSATTTLSGNNARWAGYSSGALFVLGQTSGTDLQQDGWCVRGGLLATPQS